MDELLWQYAEKFKENFPIFFVKHLSEEEIKELIKQSINANKPFQADYEKDAMY